MLLGLMRRLISITLKLGVLAAGIGAIIGYANLSDLEGWKKDLQDQIMRTSQRRFHIDGPIDFKITMPPQIIAEGIRIENAKWGKKRDMLKAKRLVAEVDFLPLLVGDVAVPRLRLEGADILIEVARGGKTNWDEFNSLETAAGGRLSEPRHRGQSGRYQHLRRPGDGLQRRHRRHHGLQSAQHRSGSRRHQSLLLN
jgi:uncharacterized protein involved in outer membrane biogenesis